MMDRVTWANFAMEKRLLQEGMEDAETEAGGREGRKKGEEGFGDGRRARGEGKRQEKEGKKKAKY